MSIFESQDIRLGPLDHEKDPLVASGWTHDSTYLQAFGLGMALAHSAAEVRKAYEALENRMDQRRDLFHFAMRARKDDRLLGFARLDQLDWSHATARVNLGIGAAADRGRGFGTQARDLILQYAFQELNLHRVGAMVPEYNAGALRFAQRAGFVIEVRQRQALQRGGRRWDMLILGLLQEEWRLAS